MSTFEGLLKEIPGISVDCFDKNNWNSTIFFLSHCHTDHTKGLSDEKFCNRLKSEKNIFLYCSHISKLILENAYHQLPCEFVIGLPLDEPRIIEYRHNNTLQSITVTCISSGHCPGSVMFLFTIDRKKILYTGDFRFNIEDFSRIKSLHYIGTRQRIPISIDNVYLDSTFLDLNFKTLPTRTESKKALCQSVKDWIEKNPKNVVVLEISALYGSEFLYTELSKSLSVKVHVQDRVYKVYSKIECVAPYVTNNGESTFIHACMPKKASKDSLQCRLDVTKENILTVIPSVMRWRGKDTSCVSEWNSEKFQTLNICYSTHASYNELEAFLAYFKPKEIFLCVFDEGKELLLEKLLQKLEAKSCKLQELPESSKITFSSHKTSNVSNFKSKIVSDDDDDNN